MMSSPLMGPSERYYQRALEAVRPYSEALHATLEHLNDGTATTADYQNVAAQQQNFNRIRPTLLKLPRDGATDYEVSAAIGRLGDELAALSLALHQASNRLLGRYGKD